MKTLCSAILLSFLAQGPSSVGGVVQDPAGAALDAASVSILSARGSVIETVRTGPDGQFLFSPIRPGNYELSVEAPGFATKSQAIRLLPDRALQLQVRLNLQALSQEVTVTAELGSVAELARTPQQVTVIDESEIDRRTKSVLAQVANDSVGVALQRTSPSIGGIYIRGLTGKNVVVYVDGVRYTTSAQRGGINTFLNLNEPTELQRVELLRGPSSAQYGSDGLGGTVQLLSKTPSMSSQGIEWHGETGIFGNTATAGFGANASQSLSTPRFGMVTSLSSRRNNTFRPGGGFDTNSSLNRFLGLSSTLYGTRLPDTAFTQFGGSLRLNFMIDARTQLTASYKRNQQDGGKRYDQLIGGDGNNVAELRNLMLDFFYTKLDREFGNRFIDTTSLSFSYNRQREERVNQGGNGDPTRGIVSNFERLNAFGVQWRSNKRVSPRYEFFTGMEIYHESMAAPTSTFFPVSGTSSPSRGRVPDGARYIRAGIFSRHALEIVPERLRFVGTIRYGAAHYRVEQSDLWPADSMRTGDVSGNVGPGGDRSPFTDISFQLQSWLPRSEHDRSGHSRAYRRRI